MNAPSSSLPRTILLVEDADDYRFVTKWFLTYFGYAVDTARCAEDALALFDPKLHDLVITDNSMRGISGGEMAHIIKMRSPSTMVLMITGGPPADHPSVDLIMQKPAHFMALRDAIEKLLWRAGRRISLD